MKFFISYFRRLFAGGIKETSLQDCSKKKSTEQSTELSEPSQKSVQESTKGSPTILGCPFCGQVYLWDSSIVKYNPVSLITDKTCANIDCSEVPLLYVALFVGSLALRSEAIYTPPQPSQLGPTLSWERMGTLLASNRNSLQKSTEE